MSTFPNSPTPSEPLPEMSSEEVMPPSESTPEAPAAEVPVSETAPVEIPAEVPVEVPAEASAEAAETTDPPAPADPPMPWAIVVRHFAQAPVEACKKLNADFGLSLTLHSFNRLQKLFRTALNRDPTAGELCVLDAAEQTGNGQPHREGVGELYTDSAALAETWADMMAKHSELFAASGLFHKTGRTPPPCTLEEALTLVGRYLHRAGLTTPLSDGLPFGGKNSDGHTAVLCSPAQEADAVAAGYTPVQAVDFGDTTRSVWVRHGAAMPVTPERSGDFLVCLPAPDPIALAKVLEGERQKRRPAVGAIAALSRRSPLETVMTLCEGADLYPARLPQAPDEATEGPVALLRLCHRPVITADTRPHYLLRVPASKVRELSEAFRAAEITAVSVGQVKSGGKIRILLRQDEKDIPVAHLPTAIIRAYPTVALYRRKIEQDPDTAPEISPVTVMPLPEMGLRMASASVTVTKTGTGYAAAMQTVAAAVAPLIEDGTSTRHVRLSVSLTAADGEDAHGRMTLEVLCGLHRAAAEGGMAMEDPAFTLAPVAEGQAPEIRLSVVAYRRV